MDYTSFGLETSRVYETNSSGYRANTLLFCVDCFEYISNLYYCYGCIHNVKNLFGCVGLQKSEFCILNKQYTKEEYENLAAKIIEKMQKDAEAHAEEDKKKKEQAELKNQAEAVVFTTEKFLKESGEKIKPEDKKELEEKLESLKKVKEGADSETTKKAMEELSQVAQRIGAGMYAAAQSASASSSSASAGAEAAADKQANNKKDEPVEGEIVDDKK